MKIFNIALALFVYASVHSKQVAHAAPQKTSSPQKFDAVTLEEEAHRYIVTYKKGSNEYNRRLQDAQSTHSHRYLRSKFFLKSPPAGDGAGPMFLPKENAEVVYLSEYEVMAWNENEEVESVELDRKRYLMAESTPYGIESVKALSVSDSDVSNRKVCIIDTGYDLGHPDLASDPSVVTGYEGSLTAIDWSSDGHGHGTHVAGTIAAIGGNGQGVVGVNRNGQLKLHIVRVFGDNGDWVWGSTVVAAMDECVAAGANVINMSLGGPVYSSFEAASAESITNNEGVLLVAAAGNGGNGSYFYPASYPDVMSVAAVDSSNNRASFSQHNDQVDIAAPGVGTYSTVPSSSYGTMSGTSFACPHVAGVAALVWSINPSKTNLEIRNALEQSAQDLGATGRDDFYGHGLVRADDAADYLDTITPPHSCPSGSDITFLYEGHAGRSCETMSFYLNSPSQFPDVEYYSYSLAGLGNDIPGNENIGLTAYGNPGNPLINQDNAPNYIFVAKVKVEGCSRVFSRCTLDCVSGGPSPSPNDPPFCEYV